MTTIKEKIEQVRLRIGQAAQKAGRSPNDIVIVAVTKEVPVTSILEAKEAGITVFAENRIQDALEKIPQVTGVEWQMIGHLQSNKIKPAIDLFSTIQSIDSVKLAEKINEELLAAQKTISVLIEVNVSGEPQKYGFEPMDIYTAIDGMANLSQIYVKGLMGISPNVPDAEAKRTSFKKLKNVFSVCKSIKQERLEMKYLSMGMSDDFEIAIEEGSNMVRLGRVLFR